MIHATWSRNFGLLTILAFADDSYIVMFGSRHKPALVELGGTRWRPNFIHFPRLTPLE